eukprot:6640998-Alexandrium_andersonii.AAC.1
MASIRKADLARRYGQCGSSRFWQPYRGGASHAATGLAVPMAVQPGRCVSAPDGCPTDAALRAPGDLPILPPPCLVSVCPPTRGCRGQRLRGV